MQDPKNGHTRAIIYARVSGDDRDNDAHNLNGQLDMAREHCTKHGHSIIAELPEDVKGASGAEIDLPQLNQVREMAARREFDVLVVRELDRLSRNLGKQLVVEEELKRNGVRIEYVLYDYPDNPEGRMMKNMRGTVSEYEREKIIERMMRGRRLTVKDGWILCYGRAPYGYRLEHARQEEQKKKRYTLVVYEREAKIVRVIFDWWIRERLSLSEIVRRLNGMGAPMYEKPLGVKGKRTWTQTTVRYMLLNETYAGTWHFGKRDKHGKRLPRENWVSAPAPAIVSRTVFDAAQALLTENIDRHAHGTKHNYLMARRVTCGECNRPMAALTIPIKYNGKPRYQFPYYVCRHLRGKGEVHRVSGTRVDAAVWGWLKDLLLEPKRLRENMTAYLKQQDEVVAPLRQQLQVTNDLCAQKKRECDKLLDIYLTSNISKDILDAKAQALDAELKSLERTQKELTARLDAATLTQERVNSLEQFAHDIRKRLDYADKDFAKRRWLAETLNVTGVCREVKGEKVLDAECIIGAQPLSISATTTNGGSTIRMIRIGSRGKSMTLAESIKVQIRAERATRYGTLDRPKKSCRRSA